MSRLFVVCISVVVLCDLEYMVLFLVLFIFWVVELLFLAKSFGINPHSVTDWNCL
jgi:hypothetical protein